MSTENPAAKPNDDKLKDRHRDVTSANEDMKQDFQQDDDQPPPHSDKVGGLRGNPS
ncbi:hypothetical protein [Tianweitania sediminis]|uniref:Uncharacterized protein n=1 Tax=Tianweitania sediminis TaxID=1502156 RepID=A0A8J7UG07_9HYPH|nr:hypothetical protein [Tianweitania sediminis]MBP0437659.1 hypothetical protein [Tianweitania sediminis]